MLRQASNYSQSIYRWLRRYHFIIVTVIVLFIFAANGAFLYRYFYYGLTESRLVIELKQEALLEGLNFKGYELLRQFIEKKQKGLLTEPEALPDPFEYSSTLPVQAPPG
ncbi:hypothetical protein HY477_01260 [Candidatus Uhrbacteria bacterium]|nr:hypothetical protein [Candidatus Uhrbacteria bacterium]